MTHAYATANRLSGLAASSFTTSPGPADSTRAYFNDGRMDRQYSFTSYSGGAGMVIDLGSAVSVGAIAALNSNIASATSPTLMVEGADNSGFSVGNVTAKLASSLTTTRPYHRDHVLQFPATTKRYWRLSWTWSGTFTLKVGELFICDSPTSLSRMEAYGARERDEQVAASAKALNGETFTALLAPAMHEKQYQFQALTASQLNELSTLWYAVSGPVTPFLWVQTLSQTSGAATEAEQQCLYCKLMVDAWDVGEVDYNLYEPQTLVMRSLARGVGA